MKKTILMAAILLCGMNCVHAQEPQKTTVKVATEQNEKVAEIQFDTLSHDFGTFDVSDAVVKCVFTFTNVGTAPLIIHQAMPSCGCTVPTFTKEPVKPGETGQIEVTYNGKGNTPGRFKKIITVRSNAKESGIVRLSIGGVMTKETTSD